MFNPWALLFHIVCLFAVLRIFCFLLSFPLDRSRASNIFLFRSRQKPDFRIWVLHFLVLVRVVFLDGPPSSCVLPVLNSLFLSSCHAHFSLRNKRFWKKLSFFLFARAILKVNILSFLRNLFSRILHTIFSEPIYGLSFFFLFYSFCLLLVVELLSLALLAPKCTC